MQVLSKGSVRSFKPLVWASPGLVAVLLISGCGDRGRSLDWDLRNNGSTTSGAVERTTSRKPTPDSNGVVSYPGYQVIVARRGDTVSELAARVGLTGAQLAGFNALKPDDTLRAGEVLALPVRVAGASQQTTSTASVAPPSTSLDVEAVASTALDRVDTQTLPAAPAQSSAKPTGQAAPFSSQTSGPVPVRYQVKRGETAFTIARTFGISAKSLADWNGLGPDLAVREGQYLIIPTAQDAARLPAAAEPDATPPGQGSPLPEPPSASTPLPDEKTPTAAEVAQSVPASPDMAAQRTSSSAALFAMPADGKITSAYQKKVNDGIDIAAGAGSSVRAANSGVVAAVTHDPSGDLIIVIKHSGGLLTVYTGIEAATVSQGDAVSRGQTIAKVSGEGAVHFEVRKGLDSVDPIPYL